MRLTPHSVSSIDVFLRVVVVLKVVPETSVAKTSDFSVLRPPSNKPAPLPTAQPKRQSPTTQSAAIKPASQPRPAPPSQPQLAAAMGKQAPSGKGARRPASRYNGFTHMSNCVTIDGFASADGLTIQRGGYGNTGSGMCLLWNTLHTLSLTSPNRLVINRIVLPGPTEV
jgi:hypothetical protein